MSAYIVTYLNDDFIQSIKKPNHQFLNIYVDVRSVTPKFFDEKSMKLLVNDTESSELYLRKSFNNYLKFVDYHIGLAFKHGMWARFFFFSDIGESLYHKNIDKEYKANRGRPFILTEEEYKRSKELVNAFLEFVKNSLTKIPLVYYIHLNYIETDFIPHFIMRHFNFGEQDLHVIMSRDKDLAQSLSIYPDSSYQFFLDSKKGKVLLSDKQAIKFHFKVDVELPSKLVPIYLSVCGDSSDNVIGIKGVGYKKLTSLLKEIDLYESWTDNNEVNLQKIVNFDKSKLTKKQNKTVLKLIQNNVDLVKKNLKLTDFDYLVNELSSSHLAQINKALKEVTWLDTEEKELVKFIKENTDENVYYYHIVECLRAFKQSVQRS